MKLQGVGFHPIDMSLVPDEISKLPRARRRLTEVMVKGSSTTPPTAEAARASWSLDFCLAPTAFLGDAATGRVRAAAFARTELAAPFDPSSPVARTRTDDPPVELPAQVAFRSVGYQSVALPGFADVGVAFDDARGVIRNDGMGRVLRAEEGGSGSGAGAEAGPHTLPGVYCAGWVKRGPTGVIASTMEDAFATGDAIAADWHAGAAFLRRGASSSPTPVAAGWEGLQTELELDTSRSRVVAWDDWRKIDRAERERGRAVGKEREKFTSTSEMLAVI